MAVQQNVVYYDGVPYISSAPMGNPGGSGSGLWNFARQNSPTFSFENQLKSGMLKPLEAKAPTPPIPARPAPVIKPMAPAGWTPPMGNDASFDSIINGSAPQFGKPPMPTPNVPPPPSPAQSMPSPGKPQQNFNQLGQNLMAQILAKQGAV